MARRLSNIEYATFLTDIDVFSLGLPPWGGIVQWGGIDVLVFIGTKLWNDVLQDYVTQIFLTDVTDQSAQWKAQATQEYSDAEHVFWWSLGESVLTSIYNVAQQAGAVVSTAIDSAGKLVGAVGTVSTNIMSVLVLALVGFIAYAYYGKK